MCRYFITRYTCGHRHRILELEHDCYLVDDHDNCYGCCEKEEFAKYSKPNVSSPFGCPDCRNYHAPYNRVRPADDIFVLAVKNEHQQAAEEDEKKAKQAMGKAVERGTVWSKFRARENPVARNLDGDWRMKKEPNKQMTPAVTVNRGMVGRNAAMATKTQVEPNTKKPASMVYGAVKILKRG